jgi:hypothetical protein
MVGPALLHEGDEICEPAGLMLVQVSKPLVACSDTARVRIAERSLYAARGPVGCIASPATAKLPSYHVLIEIGQL